MLACECSATAWERNQVASGTREAYSGAMLPRSRLITLKPPPYKIRSVACKAGSILTTAFEEQ